MNRLSKILLGAIIAIIVGASIIIYRQHTMVKNNIETSVDLLNSFYNAKDSSACLIDVLLEKTSYDSCDVFVTRLSKEYQNYIEYFTDMSVYEMKD